MRLGVLITYYNERELLTECLQSLAGQSHPPDEILIYDDASQFPAGDYLGGVPARVVRAQTNQGPAVGRNQLLQLAQADYIHFHDSDDLFLPGWGEAVRRAMTLKHPDIILNEIDSYRDGVPYRDRVIELRKLAQQTDLVRFALEHPILPAAGTYRREFVVQAGGYREDLWQSEDYEFHVRLAAKSPSYCAIGESLVRLRVRSESRSQRLLEVWECRLRGLMALTPLLPPRYRDALADAFGEVGSQLHRLGGAKLSRAAFAQAKALGGARFSNQSRFYRYLAGLFGPRFAEWLGGFYRRLLPSSLRQALRA